MRKKNRIERGDERGLEVEPFINEGLAETETGQSCDEEEMRRRLIPLLKRALRGERRPDEKGDVDKLADEIVRKIKKLGTRKGPVLPEESGEGSHNNLIYYDIPDIQ